MDVGQGLTTAWQAVASFVPLLVGFLVVLVLGWIIAWFVGKGVGKALHRVGLDRALHRGGVGEYFERSNWSASELCGRIIYYVALLFVFTLAFNVFGPNPVSTLLNDVIAWIPRGIVALVIVVVAAMIAKAVRDIITGALGGLSYGRLLANLAAVAILALGIIAALNQMGIATTVTTPVLIAVLATVGGVLVVGVGGGLIRPMQSRWERWLDRAEEETGRLADKGSYEAGRQAAMDRPAATTPAEPEAESAAAARTATGMRTRPGMGTPGTGRGERPEDRA
ncbi:MULTISPECIES: mechanosensitive ion channel family protein [unclassified Nocardiopsis]|uniref:mechanosensitive ion channel family protein n=1 Tax=Nocardiopsis TaxID=2013 RepID=UPI00387AB94E